MKKRKLHFATTKLLRDRRAGIAIIVAFSIIPLVIAAGVAFDYAKAFWIKFKFDQIADASALYAVSRPMMNESDATTEQRTKDLFTAQAGTIIQKQAIHLSALTVTVKTDGNGVRHAELTYSATIPVDFDKMLGRSSLSIAGDTDTLNKRNPNIDFHILLDTSPSMAFPTTDEGLTTVSESNYRHCQFACHSSHGLQGTLQDGSKGDLYAVARSYNIELRIDDESLAVSKLAQFAAAAEKESGAQYRVSISEFNIRTNFKTLLDTTADLSKVPGAVTGLEPTLYWKDRCQTESCSPDDPGDENRATASSDAFEKINNYIPDPGSGAPQDKPQAVLFIVTDGMRDETRKDHLPDFGFEESKCQALKDRGIRLGVLYTVYSPKSCSGDESWCGKNVAPRMDEIEPALKACSSDGLFVRVDTDQDIVTALQNLFAEAITTARISH
ncbi:hypothetical protein CGLAMM_05605 [Acetobacteraceae bacterium EV16G]|uniref:VWFA domain-containing protein n=1 Tax=Sorlinia euscelidii TaxID=3081148 RepID=A0ABU7TZV8_9PROT